LGAAPFSFINLRIVFKQAINNVLMSRFRLWVFMLCGIVLVSFELHKFYISKTIIEYNAGTQIFEITTKLFTDDLDMTLSSFAGKQLHLGTQQEHPEANAILEEYIKKHFAFVIDGVPIDWRWVGKEVESDLTYCYMEFYRTPDFSSLTVTNDLLMSDFDGQQNIVDLSMMGSTQTLVFFKDRIQQSFKR